MGEDSKRAIDLDSTTINVLKAWRDWQVAKQEAAGGEGDGWVFTDTDGRPAHPHSISQTFEGIAVRAGVPRIRLHDIRHTHGTLLIKSGVPVKVVSERLGHGNPAFTIDTTNTSSPACKPKAPGSSRISSKSSDPEPPVEGT